MFCRTWAGFVLGPFSFLQDAQGGNGFVIIGARNGFFETDYRTFPLLSMSVIV